MIRRMPLTLALAALPVALQFVPSFGGALQFDRHAILAGEVWRLATCHFVHFGWDHLALSVLGFALLGALVESRGPRGRAMLAIALAAGAIAIPAATLALRPDVECYRGLSGLDATQFALLAATSWRALGNARRALLVAFVLAFAVKLADESAHGSAWFTSAVVPLGLAHAAGAAAGLACALAALLARRRCYAPATRATRRSRPCSD